MDPIRREILQQLGLMFAIIPTACAGDLASPWAPDQTAAVPPSLLPASGYMRSRTGSLPAIIKPPADLIASKLILPYSRSIATGGMTYPTYTYRPGAWGEVGLALDMGGTGERPEIGIVTDHIAAWVAGGSPTNMLVQAEANGSTPIHFRHHNGVPSPDGTGEPVNLLDDPRMRYASCYGDPRAVNANPWFDRSGAKVNTDLAHFPNLCYVPYLATGDLYYLQEVQDAATYSLIWANPEYRKFDKALLQDDQTRGYAWGLNLLASAYIATKIAEASGKLSAPLLPSSYWKRILDNNRAEFERRWVKNGDNKPLIAACHFAVDITEGNFRPWQQDMLGAVMGWMLYTGQFPEWRSNYEWHMQQAFMRASGSTGYPRTQAARYEYKLTGATDMASLARINGLTETGSGHYPPDVDKYYVAYLRANLKLAALNGVSGAEPNFAFVDSEARRLRFIPMKWAF